jgi:hypothetical protein
LVRRLNPSEASPPYFFCSFACFVSSIPGSFLLDLQRCFALALFGHEASLGFLCFALSLRSEFGGAHSLFSLFRLTQFLSAFALSSANRTRLVYGHSRRSMPLRDNVVSGRGTKLFQRRFLRCCGTLLTLLKIRDFEPAHLISDVLQIGL